MPSRHEYPTAVCYAAYLRQLGGSINSKYFADSSKKVMKDVNWFKNEFEPYLKGYDVKFNFFSNGDLGDLSQVEFNSKEKGGEIEFWSSEFLYIHFVNYIDGAELLNILLEPQQYKEKDKTLNKLKELL